MLPTLRPGSIVVAWRRRTIHKGDIVIVRHQGLEKIKRIGDVRPGHVYVVGDNPAASTDSRTFGWITRDAVVATVLGP